MRKQPTIAIGDPPFGGADAAAGVNTTPSALISPVSGVIGRNSEILNSSVV